MPKTTLKFHKECCSYFYHNPFNGMNEEIKCLVEKKEEDEMFDKEKAIKEFGQLTQLDEDAANVEFVKNYMADIHKIIDSQVRNSLISLCHVMIYRIRSQQASMYNRPEKILDEIYQFCFSLTTVDSTEEFNNKLINFIGVEDAARESSAGDRSGENKTDKSSD